MLASLAFRVTSAIAPILTVPIALHSLGRDTFGLWTAVTAITTVLAFADLGLGNGLMTEVSALRGGDAPIAEIGRVVGISYSLVIGISSSLLAISLAICWLVSWPHLLHQDDYLHARLITSVCLFTFLANVPASLIVRVMFAFQESASSYIWQCLGPAFSLGGASIAALEHLSAPLFLLAATSGPLVANLLTTLVWFSRRDGIALTLRVPSRRDARELLTIGSAFLAISILLGISTNLDLMIIPGFAGTGAAADYSVPWRAYSQLGMVLSLLSIPFWSAAGEALARGDHAWVRRRAALLGRLNLAVMAPATILGVLAGPELLRLWVGNQVHADRLLLIGFGLWWCVMAVMYPLFMVQNGAGVLRHQILGWTAFTLLSIGIKTALASAGYWEWLPVAAFGIYLVTVAPAGVLGYRAAIASEKTRRSASV